VDTSEPFACGSAMLLLPLNEGELEREGLGGGAGCPGAGEGVQNNLLGRDPPNAPPRNQP